LKTIFQLFKNSYRIFWNDKVGVALTFLVPLALMTIFGSIFGGSSASPQGIRLAVLNQSPSEVAKRIESTLDTSKAFQIIKTYKDDGGKQVVFDSVSIKEYVRAGNAAAALILPPDAYSDTSLGLSLKFYFDPKNEIEIQTAKGLIKQIVFTQFPSIIAQSGFKQAEQFLGTKSGEGFRRGIASTISKYFKVDTSAILHPDFAKNQSSGSDSAGKIFNFMDKIIRIEEQQLVGQDLKNPWATRSVGGWAMTFLLFTLTASSSSLFDDRKSGVMLRLLTSPVSRVHILWSKYLFNMSLGVIQLLFMFVAGWLLFDVDIFSNIFNLLLVIIAASMACTSFGMLLAAFSQTRQQAQGLGTFFILTMSAVGGAWFPTSFMPPAIQFFSKLTIVYWSMDGFLEVLWRGVGLFSILPNLGILFGVSAAVSIISVRQFRRGDIFS
jgi:ABC-2 type transport system permease protein